MERPSVLRLSAALVATALAIQVVTWLSARDRLLKSAPIALMRTVDGGIEAFPCTVIASELANKAGRDTVAQWVSAGARHGLDIRNGSIEPQYALVPKQDRCSTLTATIAWNTPFVARIDWVQWHPEFDSNGFQSFFVPAWGRWSLAYTLQVRF